jgi:hypothetical protein
VCSYRGGEGAVGLSLIQQGHDARAGAAALSDLWLHHCVTASLRAHRSAAQPLHLPLYRCIIIMAEKGEASQPQRYRDAGSHSAALPARTRKSKNKQECGLVGGCLWEGRREGERG